MDDPSTPRVELLVPVRTLLSLPSTVHGIIVLGEEERAPRI